jgi:peptidoglycan/LPS O-acetylase OafA/YrhL
VGFVPSLNSLRFFGAASVIFLHMGSYWFFVDRGWENWHVLISGGTGVLLFFVLSGYLLTTLALQEISRTGKFSSKQFFKRRALRLFPLYYFSLVVLVSLNALGVLKIPAISFSFAFFYAYNMVPEEFYVSQLAPYYTLAIEEQFYILFALLFAGFARRSRQFYWIPVILVFLVVVGLLLEPYFASIFTLHRVSMWTIFAIESIVIGVIGGFFFQSNFWREVMNRNQVISGNDSSRKLASFFQLAFLTLYLSQVAFPNEFSLSLGFVCLIYSLTLDQGSLVSRFLSWKPLVYLGTISYGIYVWGAVIIGTGEPYLITDPLAALVAILMLSMASYRFLEKPFLSLKSRKQN